MNIEKRMCPNFSTRKGQIPDTAVFHIAEGYYEGTIAWFNNVKNEVSSHFVIATDGRIAQCVDLKMSAWCNGTTTNPADKRYFGKSTLETVKKRGGNANDYTISIEFEGFYKDNKGRITTAQENSAIWLLQYIKSEIKNIYGTDFIIDREHVVGHYEINPVTKPHCPGENFPFNKIIMGANVVEEEKKTYCVCVPNVSTMGECESIKEWIQTNAPYNVIIKEE